MDKEQIYQDLSRLLNEIDQLPLDDAERLRLHQMVSEMEEHVGGRKPADKPGELGDTVDQLITRFEADHPAATGILRRIMSALGSMGV